jgi:hypothetical protein
VKELQGMGADEATIAAAKGLAWDAILELACLTVQKKLEAKISGRLSNYLFIYCHDYCTTRLLWVESPSVVSNSRYGHAVLLVPGDLLSELLAETGMGLPTQYPALIVRRLQSVHVGRGT